MMTRFLKDWTIDLKKIPDYKEFNSSGFKEMVNKDICNKIIEKNEYGESVMIRFQTFTTKINNDNTQDIQYFQSCKMGRFMGESIINFPKHIKHTIFKYNNYIDVDQVKGHPTICLELARKNNETLKAFEEFVSNPQKIFDEMTEYYGTELQEHQKKWLFNLSIYGGSHKRWIKELTEPSQEDLDNGYKPIQLKNTKPREFEKRFKQECDLIKKLIWDNNPEIKKALENYEKKGEKYKLKSEHKKMNCVVSYFLQIIENDALYHCYKYLVKEGLIKNKVCCLEKDGLCFPPQKEYNEDELMSNLNKYILDKTTFRITYKIKKYEDENIDYKLLEDIQAETTKKDYETVKNRIEDQYHLCKISTGGFMAKINGNWNQYNKSGITEYLDDVIFIDEKNKPCSLHKKWFYDDNKLKYDEIVNEPDNSKVKSNMLNIYEPYDVKEFKQNQYTHDEEGLTKFKYLIECLCNHQTNTIQLFTKWLSHLFLYEGEKPGIHVIITGQQGTGKDTLIETLTKLMGDKKVFSTTNPERHVWGDYTSLLQNAKLVHISEISKANVFNHKGKFKGLVTDPKITIKAEGKTPFVISSYHAYITATNDNEPIEAKKGNRRDLLIRTSTKLKENKEFFDSYYKKIDNKDFLLTIYNYLINIENVPKRFTETDLKEGMSNLQTDLMEQNEDIEKEFLRDYIHSNNLKDTEILPIASTELFKSFNEYRNIHGLDKYEYTQKKFTLQMKIYNLEDLKDCIEWKKTKKGNIFILDPTKMYYKLGMHKIDDDIEKCVISDDSYDSLTEDDCLTDSDE